MYLYSALLGGRDLTVYPPIEQRYLFIQLRLSPRQDSHGRYYGLVCVRHRAATTTLHSPE